MNWTMRAFLEAMRKLARLKREQPAEPGIEPGSQPEDPYAYAGVRNRPRRPTQSGAVALELEP